VETDEDENHQLTPEGRFALWVIAFEIPVFFIVRVAGSPELALTAAISLAISMIALRATWNQHGHSWYWIAAVIAVAIEIFVNFHVPWSNHAFRGAALLPFAVFDYLIVYGCIKLAESAMNWADTAE